MARHFALFATFFVAMFVLEAGPLPGQTELLPPGVGPEGVIGRCGCEACAGGLEHNNPVEDDATNFQIVNRWTSTSLSGGGLQQGDPTIIAWSIVPDGTDTNGAGGFVPSNMIAVWDNLFNEANAGNPDLTTRTWHARIQDALDRWGELSGIEYVYEPNDDGVTNFGAGGAVGVRGDVRIGGFNIDGAGGANNVLAFNAFPNNGDMAVDTADTGTFSNSFGNFRAFRNIYTHEQGHGIGFAHLQSNNAAFLMEPSLSVAFDGPQLDDIRAVHRNYGDFYEKSNNFQGNDSLSNATDLGSLNDGETTTIGSDGATGTVVIANETDFVSIDDNDDDDYFKISVSDVAFLDVTLTPVGATYNQSPEGGAGNTPINSSAQSNLSLALFSASGSLINFASSGGLGQPEQILNQIVAPGETIVRVQGSANAMQLYTLEITANFLQLPSETAPAVISAGPGIITDGEVGDLADSNDQRVKIVAEAPANPGDAPLAATLTFFSPDNLPSALSLEYEGLGNTPNLQLTTSIFNTQTNLFEEVDSRAVSLAEETFTINPAGDPQRFVTFPSGLTLVELIYEPTGPVVQFPWGIEIDEVNLITEQ